MTLLLVPILFFLFSVFDVHRAGKRGMSGVGSGRLPKHWVRAEPAIIEDMLSGLDFLSEAPLDLDKLRNRTQYKYVYVKNE